MDKVDASNMFRTCLKLQNQVAAEDGWLEISSTGKLNGKS